MNRLIIDTNAFFGNPDPTEQNSGTVVNPRKNIVLNKKINNRKNMKAKALKGWTGSGNTSTENGMSHFDSNNSNSKSGGAMNINSGGALAFNEDQLMNELSNVKKGGSLTGIAAVLIPELIALAPQIISAIKQKKSGGAMKIGGASDIVNSLNPEYYDDMMKLMKQIAYQKRNLKDGKVGSGKFGNFMKNAWTKIKGWYGNNKDKLKPFTDILLDSAKNTANKYIDKGADYIAQKTGNETIGKLTDVARNMGHDMVDKTTENVRNYGSGYDIEDINEEQPIKTTRQNKKKRKIIVPTEQNQRYVTETLIGKRVY